MSPLDTMQFFFQTFSRTTNNLRVILGRRVGRLTLYILLGFFLL